MSVVDNHWYVEQGEAVFHDRNCWCFGNLASWDHKQLCGSARPDHHCLKPSSPEAERKVD